MIYLVGGNGFVGSAYRRLFDELGVAHRLVTRENEEAVAAEPCDILIDANGNSRKYLAEREPMTDFDMSVRAVARRLTLFKPRLYVFLSSGDVYPDPSSPAATVEDQTPDPSRQSPYGLHKYLAERLVMGRAADWLVIRMGGFVGPGLRKNAIFDLLGDQPVWLDPESRLQFIGTDAAARLVWSLIGNGVRRRVVNLGARGCVRIADVRERIGSRSLFKPGAPLLRYELSLDTLASLTDAPLPDSAQEVERFLQSLPPR